jgi:hypothetical protein
LQLLEVELGDCLQLLRQSRGGRQHWTLAHRRWLAEQSFAHPAQQVVFEDAVEAIADTLTRLQRLEQQLVAIVPSWSMAPIVDAYQAMRGASFLVAADFGRQSGQTRSVSLPIRQTAL